MDSLEYLDEETLNGMNLYAYCNNDPINFFDPNGRIPLALTCVYLIAAAFFVVSANVIAENEKKNHTLENVVNAIGEKIEKTAASVKTAVTDYVASLVIKRDYGDKKEEHHIVARTDRRANYSKMILNSAGITINDKRNLVKVKKGVHRVMHTNTYYFILNTSLTAGYVFGGSDGVDDVLSVFRTVLGGL